MAALPVEEQYSELTLMAAASRTCTIFPRFCHHFIRTWTVPSLMARWLCRVAGVVAVAGRDWGFYTARRKAAAEMRVELSFASIPTGADLPISAISAAFRTDKVHGAAWFWPAILCMAPPRPEEIT